MKRVPLERIENFMKNNNMYPTYYGGIAEMGYNDKPLITADWWQRKSGELRTPLMDYIDKAWEGEIEVDFYDEWMGCHECDKAVKSSPDSYCWEPSYIWTSDCSVACHECIADDKSLQDDVIEFYKNDTNRAVPSWFYQYMEAHGFICYSPDEYCQRFETGWYPGQNDDPKSVADDIESELSGYDYMFKIDSVGQFDIKWSVFLKKREG